MSMMKPKSDGRARLVRWATPAAGLLIGCVYLVASWVGGHPGQGVQMFAVMVIFSLGVVLAARRSETVKGLLDRRDERITRIDLQATAFAGVVVILAILVAFAVEISRGGDGTPYSWLGAIGGVSYLAAVIAQRLRG
jgi:Kef-type K+ transport system membrane component KefB